jgi:hypothetical protein
MSTTYFNTKKSNIERLKKKSKKNKDNDKNIDTDKNIENNDKERNNDDKEKKVVETFIMNPFSGEKNDTESDDKSDKETDPAGNVFSSSDNTSPTSKTETNTAKSAKEQLDSDKFIIFFLHALMCVFLAYVWGFLATNYLYLSSESKNNLDYILPVEEYKLPYTNDPESESWYEYGVPYSLGHGRSIDVITNPANTRAKIEDRQKGTTYFMWLSKTAEGNNRTGIYKTNFFGALNQYIFEAVYGGLARGGRGIIRTLLSLVGVANKDLKYNEDSWDQMKDNFPRKAIAFILFPFIALNFLVPGIAICSGIATFIFGILQEHIWWGLFFSFTIGIFISMATGFYMGIQTFYVFFLYPWVNNRSSDKNKWSDIFNSLKTYMLFAFYLLICFYGYEDLGSAGGAGIMFIVVASIIMQWMKNSDDK